MNQPVHASAESIARKIQVSVLLFSVLRDRVGKSVVQIVLPAGARVGEAIQVLCARFEPIAAHHASLRVAVNEEYADLDRRLNDGDEMALITPVSGG